MKCVKCDRDANKKDRDAAGGRCPSCGQTFFTDPPSDGITDMAIRRAVELVSGLGQFHFLTTHVEYELLRKKVRERNRALLTGALFGLGGFLLGAATWVFELPPLGCLTAFLVLIALIGIGFGLSGRTLKPEALQAIRAYLAHHRPTGWIGGKDSPEWGAAEEAKELGAVSFDRVLVVDRDRTVDFLLANQFHFHYSCPVLGHTGYPKAVARPMLERLRKNPDLKVFVMHDLTPSGLKLAEQVRRSPDWFGGLDVEVVDLGLLPEQKGLFGKMMKRLEKMGLPAGGAVAGVAAGWGAELAIIRPENVLRLTARGIEEGVPFHLLPEPWVPGDGGTG